MNNGFLYVYERQKTVYKELARDEMRWNMLQLPRLTERP